MESKKSILMWLKKGDKSTSEISALLRRNYWDSLRTLNELENEKKIESYKKGKYTFWRLK